MSSFPIKEFRSHETPFYYYDLNLLNQTLEAINQAASEDNYIVHYAIKANANPAILNEIRESGLGVDCVSGGEIIAAINAGFSPDKIVFAGVGKNDKEITLALEKGISCFNVESIPELEVIQTLAEAIGKTANIALRVNPNIDAHTHHYITTGLEENKFGLALQHLDDAIKRSIEMPNINLIGLHFHIGSQITINRPFELLCNKINELTEYYSSKGITFKTINVGGGLGIDYDNPDTHPISDFKHYFNTFRKFLKLSEGQQLHFELGRAVVAQCGSLITKVLYIKHGIDKQFAIVDAGMTELIRPALYQAHHTIQNITSEHTDLEKYDIVGPICESSDCFGVDEILPTTTRGDLIAIRSAGAYGEIMASQYNCRNLPKSIYSTTI